MFNISCSIRFGSQHIPESRERVLSNLTRTIEKYIHELFESEGDESIVSLRRKELAETFGCVPSQINYVLRSRFTPERGFLVESQRGGHGYIRILRVAFGAPSAISTRSSGAPSPSRSAGSCSWPFRSAGCSRRGSVSSSRSP